MDIEKLIRRLRNDADAYRNGKTLGRAFADQEDVLDNAATALSTLQAENEKLRAELERVRYEKDKAIETLSDNLRAAYQSRDAAIKDLNTLRKQSGWRCFACYFNDHYERSICTGCDYNDGNNWQWRGQKED